MTTSLNRTTGETTMPVAETDHDVARPICTLKASVPERDRHTWSLFEDWCTAQDESALPAAPGSLAHFLRAPPAAPATQYRRIAVIDAAHGRHALPPPGRAETVRAALDAARTARLRDLTALIGGIIARLPESGWPSALFARRDALILTLASAGLPYVQIAALRVCDVTPSSGEIDALRVKTPEDVHVTTSQELVRAAVFPTTVFRRWCEVLGHHERYPSTRMLAESIEAVDGGADLAEYDRHLEPGSDQPLLTPIDRWGHTPLVATPLTARAIADIVRMHLNGRAPTHRQPRARTQHPEADIAAEPASAIELDPGYYERGTRARRHAHDFLGDVDSALADVESRADSLLEDLLEFLESEEARA